jgi:serine/threonine protein kinase
MQRRCCERSGWRKVAGEKWMLTAGEVVNERYRVRSLLGKGGLSYVYEVEDLQLPTRWALKEFHPRNLHDDEIKKVREQFSKEVAILSRLKHPRLPYVSDSFTFEDHDYMVMELVEGKTLDELIRERHEPFPEDLVKEWALQILEILEYLHSQNPPIIYRDIKPQNIIVSSQFGIRFIDFGIARLFNPVKEQDTLFMGTPGFAPPEQFRQRQTDIRSDIYSLGATIHYLLSLQDPGAHPFDFAPLSVLNPKVSPLMERAVQKAVEIRAENRFQNAKDMQKVLLGEVSIDVFRQGFIIVDPREITMADLDPRLPNKKELTIKSSAGEVLQGHLTSEHPGLHLDPVDFDAPLAKIALTADGRKFPRGEKTLTSVILSTATAKMTIPVSVQFKPTFIRGLSPAVAGVLFFLIPLLAGIVWRTYLLEAHGGSPMVVVLLIVASSAIIGFFVPSKHLDTLSIALYLCLCAPMILLGQKMLNLQNPQIAIYSNVLTTMALFQLFSAVLCIVLFLFALQFSPRQKTDMRLIIIVSFFVFPFLLYMISFFEVISGSFIFSNKLLSFALSSLTSLLFSLQFLRISISESRVSNLIPPSAGKVRYGKIIRYGGLIVVSALFACLWYWLCSHYDSFNGGSTFLAGIPVFLKMLEYTVFLPNLLAAFYHYGKPACIAGVTLLALLFYLLAPRFKFPARALVTFLILGCSVNFFLSLEQNHRTSMELFRKSLMTDPLNIINDPNFARSSPRWDTFARFYGTILGADNKLRIRQFKIAADKYSAALNLLTPVERNSTGGRKIRYLMDQAKIWDYFESKKPGGLGYFDDMLSESPENIRGGRLKIFDSSAERRDDMSRFMVLPDKFFCFVYQDKILKFENDYEVLATVRFYKGLLYEFKGANIDGKRSFKQMKELLDSLPGGAIKEALEGEWKARQALYSSLGDIQKRKKEYYIGISTYYRGRKNNNLALPLLSLIAEKFSSTISESGELIETYYSLGATESGDLMVEKLLKKNSLAGPGQLEKAPATFYSALKEAAHGKFSNAYSLLESLSEMKAFEDNIPYIRKKRDIAATLRYWEKVHLLSNRIEKLDRKHITADDCLVTAFSYDITGSFEKAKPYYEKYVNRKDLTDIDRRRAAIVRNRLTGGPVPSYIILEQIHHCESESRYRVLIEGEGVPQEFIPELVYYHGLKDSPRISMSENIRLLKLKHFSNKNYTKIFNRVEFKDPAKEEKERSYRFFIYYDFENASYFPIEFTSIEPVVFNSKYVKEVQSRTSLRPDQREMGIHMIAVGDHWLAVIPRFRFIYGPQSLAYTVDYFHNCNSPHAFKDIYPDEIKGLLTREALMPHLVPDVRAEGASH